MEGLYLKFKNTEYPGKVYIVEPVGWDGQSLTVDTDADKLAVDVWYNNPEIALKFWDLRGEPIDEPLQLPNGELIYYKSHALAWLLEYKRLFGYAAKVEIGNTINDVDFPFGNLDFFGATTDGVDEFSCKIIDSGKRVDMKRDMNTKLDLLTTKDLKGNTITPPTLTNIFFRPQPINGKSIWKQNESIVQFAGGSDIVNFAAFNELYGVKNSLVPFDQRRSSVLGSFQGAVNNFVYIDAVNNLSNVKLRVDMDIWFLYRFNSEGEQDRPASIKLGAIIALNPYDPTPSNAIYFEYLLEYDIQTDFDQNVHLPDFVEVDLPDIPRGFRLHLFWQLEWSEANLGTTDGDYDGFGTFVSLTLGGLGNPILPITLFNYLEGSGQGRNYNRNTAWIFDKADITITATESSFSSVVKGLRWSTARQTAANIITGGGYVVDQPKFLEGGEHYDNFLINGYGFRGFTDKPFTYVLKDDIDQTQEMCGDIMLGTEKAFAGEYEDFFTNNDMGGFDEIAPVDFAETHPADYFLRTITQKYSSYEQNRDESETLDSVHTEVQHRFATEIPSETERQVILPWRRDPFGMTSDQKQSITAKPDTSLGSDDNISVLDCVPLAPGFTNYLNAILITRINPDNTITVLNRSSADGAVSGFGWNTQGLIIGSVVTCTNGLNSDGVVVNVGTYEVVQLDVNFVVLKRLTILSLLDDGDVYYFFNWVLSDVPYINRFNEGFDLIEGVANPNQFSNLNYTFGNMRSKWRAFFASCQYYALRVNPLALFTTQYFKNNDKLKTRKTGSDVIISEKEDLTGEQLGDPILLPDIYATRFKISYAEMLELWNKIENVRGFVRIRKLSGEVIPVHIRKAEYTWTTNVCELTGILRFTGTDVAITKTDGIIYINTTPYNSSQLASYDWFEINRDYVQVYDNNRINVFNPVLFNQISVNGVKYTNENDFRNAMLSLR